MNIRFTHNMKKILLASALMSVSIFSWSVGIENGDYSLTPYPTSPTTSDEVFLNMNLVEGCNYAFPANEQDIKRVISINNFRKEVRVSLEALPNPFTPCPVRPQRNIIFSIGTLSNIGDYKVYFYISYEQDSSLPILPFEIFTGVFTLSVKESSLLVTPEVPQAGSIQSGVGLIRGWACDAKKVEIQFDDKPRIAISYGTSRGDTIGRCGDENNGYGMVVNWTALGKGSHQMKTFIDDNQVADVTFEVAGLDEDFIAGLSGTYQLEDFPAPGKSVTVEWSEADQNFIIIDEQ